jgi:hypothetical protein
MTTEVNESGPVQVGEVDADTLAAAAKEGISLPPDASATDGENKASDPNALPSDENASPDENAAERPAWLPEKFKTVEEMAAAYSELEKKQGQPEKAPEPNDGTKPPETEVGKQAADIVQKAGLEWSKLNEEWSKDGKLSDASYEAFKAQGVSKDLVDGFISGQNAIAVANANVIRNAAFEAAGGEAKYMEAVAWAKTGLDPAQIVAFDKVVSGNDPAAVKMAVQGLMASYSKAGASEPSNLGSGERGGQGVYANVEQMIADMSDPRYESDPAFRKRVEQKASRSNI